MNILQKRLVLVEKLIARKFYWMPTKPLEEKGELTNDEKQHYYRTSINLPPNQSLEQIGKLYRFPTEHYKKLFTVGRCFRSHIIGQIATFQEFSLMIRKSALEIMYYLKNSDLSSIINRYILYGPNGSGKSMTLAHLIHYIYLQENFILFHIPSCPVITVNFKEIVPSTTKTGKFDSPFEANFLLKHFKSQNEEKLKKFQLTTSQEYVWSKREKSPAGSPLMDVVNLGIERSIYATDIVGILLKELREQAAQKGFKCIIVGDALNALFGPSQVLNESKEHLDCSDLSLVHSLKKMLKNDWTHGAVIGSVDDQYRSNNMPNESYLPKSLLKSEGFEFFDPFIPVRVDNFGQNEVSTMVDYYVDMNWLQHPEASTVDLKREIFYLTGGNGLDLYNFSRCW